MSSLVWAVESAVLGAWALVLSSYSTPFHVFIARSHSLIAGFTLILQLISTARDLPVGHAISEAFVCAVTSLLLVYVATLLDTANHTRFFSMSSAGLLPMDAVIGLAWFCAAFTSALGMALSAVGKEGKKASLMFHQYGYHMSIVLPSLLMLWLYNYNARDEFVSKGIKAMGNFNVTHTVLFITYSGIWGWFIVAQFIGEGLFTMGKEWPSSWSEMSYESIAAYIAASAVKFLGRGGCVLIPLSAVFVANTFAQTIMGWAMVGVAGAYAVDLMGMFDNVVGKREKNEDTGQPAMEGEFIGFNDPAAVVMADQNKGNWKRDKMV